MSDLGRALVETLDDNDIDALAKRVAQRLGETASAEAPSPNVVWTAAEAAARADCGVETIRRAARSRKLVARRVGSRWRIVPEDLEAWMCAPGSSEGASKPTGQTRPQRTARRLMRDALRQVEKVPTTASRR